MQPRDPSEFDASPWEADDLALQGPAASVPTMLCDHETRLYRWLTASWAEGAGAVVDLGTFLGGSTARLAQGLAQAGHDVQVHGYDRFHMAPEKLAARAGEAGFTPAGDDNAEPLVAAHLAPWRDRVVLHRGEIEQGPGWDGGPIEILVIDAAKTPETADAFAAMFFPALIPGRSLVVQQDCLHWRQPWLPVQMHLLRAQFEPVAIVPNDCVVFLNRAPVTAEALTAARVAGMSDAAMERHLIRARKAYRRFRRAKRIWSVVRALRRNPGVRVAYRMKARRERRATEDER